VKLGRIKEIEKKLEKMKKLFKLREKREEEYERTKEEFRKALGKPSIHFDIEIPKGYEDMTDEFLQLEGDEKFKGKIENLVKRQLRHERREKTKNKIEEKETDTT